MTEKVMTSTGRGGINTSRLVFISEFKKIY